LLLVFIFSSPLLSWAQGGSSVPQTPLCDIVASPTNICVGDTVFFNMVNTGVLQGDTGYFCQDSIFISTAAASAYFYPYSGHPGIPLYIMGTGAMWINTYYVYTSPGQFTPTITINQTGTAGPTTHPIYNQSLSQALIEVLAKPSLSLTNSQISQCFAVNNSVFLNSILNFTNVSQFTSAQLTVDWGDGNSDAFSYNNTQGSWPSMGHTYANTGSYLVEITGSNGLCDTTVYLSVNLEDLDGQLTYTSECNTDNLVEFEYLSACLQGASGVTYDWYFGDGTQLLGTPQSDPSHNYPGPGTYTVNLVIHTSNGTFTATETITVTSIPNLVLELPITNNCDEDVLVINWLNYGLFPPGTSLNVTSHPGNLLGFNHQGNVAFLEVSGGGVIGITAIDPVDSCESYAEIEVYDCCNGVYDKTSISVAGDQFDGQFTHTPVGQGPADLIWSNTSLSQAVASGNAPANGVTDKYIEINGTFVLDGNYALDRCQVFMGPEAQIVVQPGVVLSMNESIFRACGDVIWNRIHASDPTSSIFATATKYYNARRALSVTNGAFLRAQSCYFNENHTGVYMGNYFGPAAANGPYPASVQGCSFNDEHPGPGLQVNLLYPLQTMEAQNGLHIASVEGISIDGMAGGLFYDFNRFFMSQHGILLENSTASLSNNAFENHTTGNPNASPKDMRYGIRAVRSSHSRPGYTLQVQGVNPQLSITEFSNNDFGIYTKGYRTDIQNLEGEDHYIGVQLIDPRDQTLVKNTEWETAEKGIVAQNVFEVRRDVKILENTLVNCNLGIQTTQLRSVTNELRIANNTIDYTSTAAQQYRVGIHVEACAKARIHNNVIGKTSALTPGEYGYLYGIFLAESEGAKVYNNSTEEMGHGIHCVGYLSDAELYCNDIDGSHYGVFLEQGTPISTTFMTDQRLSGAGQVNFITNNIDPWEVYGFNSNFNPPPKWNFHTGASGGYVYDVWPFAFNPGLNRPYAWCGGATVPGGGTISEDTVKIPKGYVLTVAKDSLEASNLEEEIDYKAETHVYRELSETGLPEGTTYADSIVMANFMQQVYNSDQGLWEEYTHALREGRIDTATAYLELMAATGNMEQNMRTTGQAYQTGYAFDNAFDNATELTLQTIALQTPYVGGRGVYSARVMLGLDNWMYDLPYKTEPNMQMNDLELELEVYPNPAQEYLNVRWSSAVSGTLRISNIQGQLIMEDQLEERTWHAVDVSNLKKGVYILSVDYADGTSATQQVILGQ